MESRFAKLMLYREDYKQEAKHAIKAEAHIPSETISILKLDASLARAKMEKIIGQKLIDFGEEGNFLRIKFDGEDKELDKNVADDFRITAEKAMLFEKVADYFGLGYHLYLGKDNDPSVSYEDQVRIMVTEAKGQIPKMIYTRIMFGYQALDLINKIFSPKLDTNGLDERDELRSILDKHLQNGNMVLLKPARKFN